MARRVPRIIQLDMIDDELDYEGTFGISCTDRLFGQNLRSIRGLRWDFAVYPKHWRWAKQEQHIFSGIPLNSQTPRRRLFYLMHIGWLELSSLGENQTRIATTFLILVHCFRDQASIDDENGQEGTARYLVYRVWLFGHNLRSFQEFR